MVAPRQPISRLAGPEGSAESPEAAAPETRSPAQFLLIGICLASLAWAYWPTLLDLKRHWDASPDYSHGYLVAPLAVFFLWRRRDLIPREGLAPAWGGLSLIALAGLMRLASARFYLPEVDGWSIPVWMAGVVWLFGGWRLVRWSAPALAFLWFMVPLPASVETLLNGPLQQLATSLSTWTLQCLGQPAIAEGTTIWLDDHRLEVERACSGLRMFYGIAALAVAYIIVKRTRLIPSLLLLASVAPVAIAANLIRITMTGLLYQFASSDAAQKFSHDFAGLIMIVAAVALFGAALWMIERTLWQFHVKRSRALLRLGIALLVVALLVPTAFGWHKFQQGRNLEGFLTRAAVLEQEGKFSDAAWYLDRYLVLRPDDFETRRRFALTFDQSARGPLRKERAMEILGETWALRPAEVDLGIRQAELAIELAKFETALRAANQLMAIELGDAPKTDALRAAASRFKALALLGRNTAVNVVVQDAEWQATIAAFDDAIRRNPADIELPARLADVYRHRVTVPAEAERIRLADETIDAMVERNADLPHAWLARYVYRVSLQNLGEPVAATREQAEADLDHAVEMGRNDPAKENVSVLLFAGERAIQRKNRDEARAFYERAALVEPRDHRGWVRYGETVAAEGTDEARIRAVEIWQKGLDAIQQQEIDLILPMAAALVELKRFADSEEKLKPLDAAIPDLAEPGQSVVQLGVVRLRAATRAATGRLAEGAAMLRTVLNESREKPIPKQYHTRFADGWLQIGDYYNELKQDDLAAEAFEAAGRLDPNSAQWRMKAARAADRSGRAAAAVTHFRQAAKLDPQNPLAWLALARAVFLEQVSLGSGDRNWSEFHSAFQQAVERKANAIMLPILEADYAAANGKLDEAATILEKATAAAPKSWELWQTVAVIQNRREADAEVAEALAELEKHAPKPETAARLKARFALDDGRADESKRLLEAVLPKCDVQGQYQIRQELVELALRRGDRAEARQILQQMAASATGDLEALDQLALVIADDRDWTELERVEERIRREEGEDGTLWREFRARRLLPAAAELNAPEFRELTRLAREIARLRPSWHRLHVLLGQIARRENRLDEAISSYQQAIRLGNRSIGLSEELIDLLVEQKRFAEADREFQRVRDAVARSSRLSNVAIPIFVRRGEADEALRLAEDWVKRQPDDPTSHLRLARTVLLATPEDSSGYAAALERAREAYERAVQLAPNDVRSWISLFRYYTRIKKDDRAAREMLQRLAERLDVPQDRKVFVLAQLYDSIGNRGEAGRLYLEAVKLAKDETKALVYRQAAQFFVAEDPAQAEMFCRESLKREQKSIETRRILVRALAEQGGEERLREAADLLRDVGRIGGTSAADRRLESMLLARSKRPEDQRRATELLEGLVQIPQQALAYDRVILASLYEKDNRLQPARDQLWTIAREETAAPLDLVRFAEFLFRNFREQPQFFDEALQVIERLETIPEHRISAFRLRLVAVKQSVDEAERPARFRKAAAEFAGRYVKTEQDAAARRDLLARMLILMLKENLATDAVDLASKSCPSASPVDCAIALANACTVVPLSSEARAAAEPFLVRMLAEHADSPELLFAAGNSKFVTGRRDDAVALYRKTLLLQSEHKDAMNNLAVVLAEERADAPEALKIVDAALSKFGDDASLLDTKGQVLVQLGRADEARQVLSRAAGMQNDPLILLHLANACLGAEKPSDARVAYRRALDLNVAAAIVTPQDRALLKRVEAAAGGSSNVESSSAH